MRRASADSRIHLYHRLKLVMVLLALTLSGCGFSLRGSDAVAVRLPALQLYLQQPGSEMARLVRRGLQDADVNLLVVDGEQLAEDIPVLAVGAEQLSVRAVTVTPLARAAQYEIRIALPVSLTDGVNRLLGPEELTVEQIYYENTGNITGTLEEREVIQSEMRRELVRQLLLRLEASAEIRATNR